MAASSPDPLTAVPGGTAFPERTPADIPASSEGSAVPIWAQVLGGVLLLAFVALSAEAYFGPGLRNRLLAFGGLSGWGGAPGRAIPPRVFYEPGSSASAGQRATGSEGQQRTYQEGDTVLLGATGQLVRLTAGGQAVELRGVDGASTTVANLGVWDPVADQLAGVPARFLGGRWVLDEIPLLSVGAPLHPPGAPSEALPDGFWLGPEPKAGRVRRVSDGGHAAIRLRASKKLPSLTLESRQPLQSLTDTLVSVTAVVRGTPGKPLVLTLRDVVDAGGAVETVAERVAATEAWTTLTVRRRLAFPASGDGFSVGVVDAEAGDWFEVRDLDVVLGAAP